MNRRAAAQPGLKLVPLSFTAFACSLASVSFVALAAPLSRSLDLQPWQAGAVIAASGLAWIATVRRWGVASDRRGRRGILLLGVLGFASAFAALNLFIAVLQSALLPVSLAFCGLLFLRALCGVFHAAVPVTTTALIADHVRPEQRAAMMGRLGAAGAVGMVAGPGLVGLLAGQSLVLPLAAATLLSVVGFLLLWRALPPDAAAASAGNRRLALGERGLMPLLLVSLMASSAVGTAQVSVGFFALDRLGLSVEAAGQAAGLSLLCVGIALILAQLSLSATGWTPRRLILAGGLIAGTGFAAVIPSTTTTMLYASYFVAAFGMGWISPAIASLVSGRVERHEQGAAAGSLSTAQGLGMIVGPLAGTILHEAGPFAPYAVLTALMLVIALAAWMLADKPSEAGFSSGSPRS